MSTFERGETSTWYNVYRFERLGSWTALTPELLGDHDPDFICFCSLDEADEFRTRWLEENPDDKDSVYVVEETRRVVRRID